MTDPPSPGTTAVVEVVVADEQDAMPVDAERWGALAAAVLATAGVSGELTLTFVDADEIAALNAEHLGKEGPTDVLSFPLDVGLSPADLPVAGVPVLLGDVVVCPEIAAAQAPTHAGTVDDELALLVVHGVLHVLGDDHAESGAAAVMRQRELTLLEAHHWHGPAPAGFRQEHDS